MTRANSLRRTLYWLVGGLALEQAVGVLLISWRIAFSIVPGIFAFEAETLTRGRALACAVFLGILYDIRSTLPFGIFIAAFLALALAAQAAELYVASNRFIPLAALGLGALLLFYVVRLGGEYMARGTLGVDHLFAEELAWNSALITIRAYATTHRRYL